MSGNQSDKPLKTHKHKLNEDVFKFLSKVSSTKFGFLKLGPLCNASESNSFKSAKCHIQNVTNKKNGHYTLDLKRLFQDGCDLLENMENNTSISLDERKIAAVKALENFFDNKDEQQKSLVEVLLEKENVSEGKVTVTLAEHLFKNLASGRDCVIDNGTKDKRDCTCKSSENCGRPLSENTGIGHKGVWHGFIDIVLYSQSEEPENVDEDIDDRQDIRNIIEVKCSLSEKKFEVMDQAIAQTIVFSFLKKKCDERLRFIPNILISREEFRILMYDVENDLLICSQPLFIFFKKSLRMSSMIILWMVLHYELFVRDIRVDFESKSVDLKKFQANFKKRAKDKLAIYEDELKFGEKLDGDLTKEYFPCLNELMIGEDVFK